MLGLSSLLHQTTGKEYLLLVVMMVMMMMMMMMMMTHQNWLVRLLESFGATAANDMRVSWL